MKGITIITNDNKTIKEAIPIDVLAKYFSLIKVQWGNLEVDSCLRLELSSRQWELIRAFTRYLELPVTREAFALLLHAADYLKINSRYSQILDEVSLDLCKFNGGPFRLPQRIREILNFTDIIEVDQLEGNLYLILNSGYVIERISDNNYLVIGHCHDYKSKKIEQLTRDQEEVVRLIYKLEVKSSASR